VTPASPSTGPVTVGVFHPFEQLRSSGDWAGVVAQITAVDPRVSVIGEQYSEPHAVRVLRRSLDPDAARVLTPELTEAQLKALAAVDIAVALDLPPEVASHAPNLRWVQSYGAGTAHLLAAGLVEAGIVLTSGAGVNATGIAEFAVARVLQHWKAFRTFDDFQSRRHWDHSPTRELAASTVGLIGLGAINGAVATRLQAFDVRVLATRRSAAPGDTAPAVDELYPAADLHAMLRQCDAVVAAVPGTVETEQLMDAAAFAAMKPGAFFVNVGRGSLVDEAALLDVLRSGHLSGAALDVTVNEPMPADDPLWDAPNVYLSPHSATAGGSLWPNLLKLFCENLRRYLAGEELLNEVDPERGY
jgi:phosphoglycerate dehydrogenase-like enzyme